MLIFNILELDLEEVTLVERLDHELWATFATFSIPHRICKLDIKKLLHLPVVHVVREVEAVFHL